MSGIPLPLTRELAATMLTYDAERGSFTWRKRTADMFSDGQKSAAHECAIWNAKHVGHPAGRINPTTGYLEIAIGGKRYAAHRLAFLIMVGNWPEIVDHINRDRIDNRWGNLRDVDALQNAQNSSKHRDGSSQYIGVGWDASRGKWKASIGAGGSGKSKFIGRFDTEEEAHAAYLRAKAIYHSPIAAGEKL